MEQGPRHFEAQHFGGSPRRCGRRGAQTFQFFLRETFGAERDVEQTRHERLSPCLAILRKHGRRRQSLHEPRQIAGIVDVAVDIEVIAAHPEQAGGGGIAFQAGNDTPDKGIAGARRSGEKAGNILGDSRDAAFGKVHGCPRTAAADDKPAFGIEDLVAAVGQLVHRGRPRMHAKLFSGAGQTVDTQDKAREDPRHVMAKHGTFAKAKRIGAEPGRFLKPVAQSRQCGHTVLPYLAIADREGEIVALFNIFHVLFLYSLLIKAG